jgi:hypothetical protein
MSARTVGALALWRAELDAGKRTKLDLDPLWRAACEEITAAEAERDGLSETAAEHRALAAGLLLVAASRKKKAVAA